VYGSGGVEEFFLVFSLFGIPPISSEQKGWICMVFFSECKESDIEVGYTLFF